MPLTGEALIELPQIDTRTRRYANIITLAITTGRITEAAVLRGWRVQEIPIPTWKRDISKERHHPRIRAACTPAELARIEGQLAVHPKGDRHNAWDAIGIAKYPARGCL